MLSYMKCVRGLLVGLVVVLGACGGGGGSGSGGSDASGGDTTAPAPAMPNILAVSVSTMALAMAGQPRVVTVTNKGSTDALSLQYTVKPALPTGTTLNFGCTSLAPGASCPITITPGPTPTAAAGVTPVPTVLSIAGSNTDAVTTDVLVLTHGSVYQSGYVFSLKDGTPNTGSVGGKAAALNNAPGAFIWSSSGELGQDGIAGSADDAVGDLVPGINEVSVAGLASCSGRTDGKCNSRAITEFYPDVNASLYAAGACTLPNDDRKDWYLPAVCELASAGAGCGAGDNVQSRLISNGALTAAQLPHGAYWSSTTGSLMPADTAWALSVLGAQVFAFQKDQALSVRCVRALTP